MALFDTLASRLSRPAGRVLDAPIRDIVHELLKEHGYASPAEVQGLRDELRDLRTRVDGIDRRVADLAGIADAARKESTALRTDLDAARKALAGALKDAAAARADAEAARATAERPEPAADPRVAALAGKVAELEAALAAKVKELESALAALATRPSAAAAPAATPAAGRTVAPAPAAAPAPLSAEPRGGCKVPECPEMVRSKGFCSAHYQQWRRGTLRNFVNADGTALVEGRVVHLPADTIGGLVSTREGRLFVDGRQVKEVPAS
ncbi:MAG: hypothetical protein ACK4YP_12350 [Myxococcota bacterium]